MIKRSFKEVLLSKSALFLVAAAMTLAFTIQAFAMDIENISIASLSDAFASGQNVSHNIGNGIVVADKYEAEDMDDWGFDLIDEASPSNLIITDITPLEDEPTYNFSIRKLQPEGMIFGAVFRLYRSLDDANYYRDPIYFTLDEEELLYTACPSSGCPSSPDLTRDITAGMAFIEGLPAGNYYLVEIAAPKGYHKLHYPYRIELWEDGRVFYSELMSGDGLNEAIDGDVLVFNYAVMLMPGTGGPGKYLLYILGTGCIMAAIFMALCFKKRGDN